MLRQQVDAVEEITLGPVRQDVVKFGDRQILLQDNRIACHIQRGGAGLACTINRNRIGDRSVTGPSGRAGRRETIGGVRRPDAGRGAGGRYLDYQRISRPVDGAVGVYVGMGAGTDGESALPKRRCGEAAQQKSA